MSGVNLLDPHWLIAETGRRETGILSLALTLLSLTAPRFPTDPRFYLRACLVSCPFWLTIFLLEAFWATRATSRLQSVLLARKTTRTSALVLAMRKTIVPTDLIKPGERGVSLLSRLPNCQTWRRPDPWFGQPLAWQVCTEWGYFADSTPGDRPSLISKLIDLPYSSRICRLAFGDGMPFPLALPTHKN